MTHDEGKLREAVVWARDEASHAGHDCEYEAELLVLLADTAESVLHAGERKPASAPTDDAEMLALLNTDTLINRVRRQAYRCTAEIAQLSEQRTLSPIRMRHLEFQSAAKIINMVLDDGITGDTQGGKE
jgi:hypothetical protein